MDTNQDIAPTSYQHHSTGSDGQWNVLSYWNRHRALVRAQPVRFRACQVLPWRLCHIQTRQAGIFSLFSCWRRYPKIKHIDLVSRIERPREPNTRRDCPLAGGNGPKKNKQEKPRGEGGPPLICLPSRIPPLSPGSRPLPSQNKWGWNTSWWALSSFNWCGSMFVWPPFGGNPRWVFLCCVLLGLCTYNNTLWHSSLVLVYPVFRGAGSADLGQGRAD